jgi:hypothetical protein
MSGVIIGDRVMAIIAIGEFCSHENGISFLNNGHGNIILLIIYEKVI